MPEHYSPSTFHAGPSISSTMTTSLASQPATHPTIASRTFLLLGRVTYSLEKTVGNGALPTGYYLFLPGTVHRQ